MRRREQSKQQDQQKKHKWSSLKSLSTWVDFGAWRGLNALIVSWRVAFCSCIECWVQKTWMAWMEVVGGIYSPNHLFLPLMSMVNRTWHCSLSGACHVSRPLGFGAVDHWSPLSSCCTGQSGAFWLSALTSDFHCSPFTVDCWAGYRCSVGSLDIYGAHQTVGEL